MTVAAKPATVTYLEDGASVSFPVPFRFKAATDLIVERLLAPGGVQTLAIGTDYSVSGGATDAGGTLKRTVATSGARLRIRRQTARAQPMTYTTGDRFPAASHEEAVDRAILISQEQDAEAGELRGRALLVPAGETLPDLPPLSDRLGGRKKIIGVNQATGAIGVEDIDEVYVGPTGPANSTFRSLGALKAAPATNGTYSLITPGGRVDYAYVAGDFTNLADDAIVIKLDAIDLSVGALLVSGNVPASAFGVSTSRPDNGPAFGRMLAACRYLALAYAIPPRVTLQSGFYRYSGKDEGGALLNWAVQGLHIEGQPGVVLIHTGAGVAFPCDGGATGGGIGLMKVTGGIVVRGNANTTDGLWNRAVHHSTFDMEIQQVSGAVLRTNWVVCNEYWIRYNPLYRPGFTTIASVGAFLSGRAVGERTSACNFYNPIFGSINGYCWNFDDALMNTVIGGTSEASVGGMFFGQSGFCNRIIGHDFEFNTLVDIFCGGSYNKFVHCLSDLVCEFGGLLNEIDGGLYNGIKSYGINNEFSQVNYGIDADGFIETGTGTNRRMMRNAIGILEPDILNRETGVIQLGKAAGGMRVGRSDLITGGSENHIVFAVQTGVKAYLNSNSGKLFGWSDDGIGFFSKALGPHAGVPAITGARGGNAALTSLIAGLAALGLVTDNTTA